MEIRRGLQEDYAGAMLLIAEFAEETLSEFGIKLDPEKLQKTFDAVFKTSFVSVIDGKIVGVLAGHVVTDICSDLFVYEEVVWYIKKEYRRQGIKLLGHVEGWCKQNKIERMTMSCMHGPKTEKLFALYERLGFRPQETRFIKELD